MEVRLERAHRPNRNQGKVDSKFTHYANTVIQENNGTKLGFSMSFLANITSHDKDSKVSGRVGSQPKPKVSRWVSDSKTMFDLASTFNKLAFC